MPLCPTDGTKSLAQAARLNSVRLSSGDVDRTRVRAQEFGQRHRNSESAQLFKNQLVTDKKIQQRAGADCHEVGNQIVEVKADCQQFHQHDVTEDGNQPI